MDNSLFKSQIEFVRNSCSEILRYARSNGLLSLQADNSMFIGLVVFMLITIFVSSSGSRSSELEEEDSDAQEDDTEEYDTEDESSLSEYTCYSESEEDGSMPPNARMITPYKIHDAGNKTDPKYSSRAEFRGRHRTRSISRERSLSPKKNS